MNTMRMIRPLVIALVVVLGLGSLGFSATLAQDEGEPAWLGVAVSDSEDGVLVAEVVEDSPAAEAGFESGDIITAVDDTMIENAEALVDVVGGYAVEDTATITLLRDDEEMTVDVTFAARPADFGQMQPPEMDMGDEMLPLLNRLNLMGLELEMTEDGVSVVSIAEDSPLAESDLQAGDLITMIDGEPVNEMPPSDLMLALTDEDGVSLTVQREGDEVEVTLNLSELLDDMTAPFLFGQPQAAPRPTQLGVSFSTLDATVAAEEELDVEEGALVREVFEDTPAAEAGLQAGDVITAVDGDVVDQERLLTDRLYAYEEDDVVTLTVLRDGEEMELDVTLGPKNTFSMQTMPFGDGRGMRQRGRMPMMPFFMHPEMREYLNEDFFDDHPFMRDMFENMPEDGFHFFGPFGEGWQDDIQPSEPAPEEMPGTRA